MPVGAPLAVLGIQAHQEDAQDDQFKHRAGAAGEDPDHQAQDDRDEIIDAPQQDQRWVVDVLGDFGWVSHGRSVRRGGRGP